MIRWLCLLVINVCTLITPLDINAQPAISNQGVQISLKDRSMVSAHGDVRLANGGNFHNHDTINVFGDWINNSGTSGFSSSGKGRVILRGDTQTIKGKQVTGFYELELMGLDVKFANLNVKANGRLMLNDRVFNADSFDIRVLNVGPSSVTNDSGYVSAQDTGGLLRLTAADTTYFFPVGSDIGSERYRPIAVEPSTSSPHSYKVRMANVDPTTEGYPRSQREDIVCEVNEDYYHRIDRKSGTNPAALSFYYKQSDGDFNGVAHWQNVPQWEKMTPTSSIGTPPPGYQTMKVNNWDNFTKPAFALADVSPVLQLQTEGKVCKGDTLAFQVEPSNGYSEFDFYVNGDIVASSTEPYFATDELEDGDSVNVVAGNQKCKAFGEPTVVSVYENPEADAGQDTAIFPGTKAQLNGQGATSIKWAPSGNLTCSFCNDPQAKPPETTDYVLRVTNRNGCDDLDTVQVRLDETIDPEKVLEIPNAITPNADGVNDVWRIQKLDLYDKRDVVIVNRWGNEVYRASPYQNDWGGTYNGDQLPEGTYYFVLKLGNGQEVNGPLTIVK